MVIAGGLVFLAILHHKAGAIPLGRPAPLILAAAFLLMFLFYKLLACILAEQTPGTKWMGLRLLHFDGRPPERRHRLLRLAAACLSVLPGCAGLLWGLADEEHLTWHDHISKTFVTSMESPR